MLVHAEAKIGDQPFSLSFLQTASSVLCRLHISPVLCWKPYIVSCSAIGNRKRVAHSIYIDVQDGHGLVFLPFWIGGRFQKGT